MNVRNIEWESEWGESMACKERRKRYYRVITE